MHQNREVPLNLLIKFFVGLSGLWASTVMAQEAVTVFDPTVAAITTTTPSAAVVLKKRTDIDQGMMTVKKSISETYKSLLETDPTAEGRVVVRLKIASDGRVLDASVQISDIENQEFLSQLIQLVKNTTFFSGHFEEMEVSYKFDFIPNQDLVFKKRTDVDFKVKNYKGRIQMAYKKILDKNPETAADGQVVIRLKIASNGQVIDASIQKSDIIHDEFLSDLIEIIKGIKFESGDFEETEVNYKFNFVNGGKI